VGMCSLPKVDLSETVYKSRIQVSEQSCELHAVSLHSAERSPELNCRMIPVEYLHRNQSGNTLLSLIIIERQVLYMTNYMFSDSMNFTGLHIYLT
jgi:hypothetical protein